MDRGGRLGLRILRAAGCRTSGLRNAGIFSFLDILRTPAERIERIILLHDLTNTQLCRLYAADMARRGRGGHILNMSSYSLWMPFPGLSLYSASKAYQINYAEGLRQRFARLRIPVRITDVRPGLTATAMARGEGLFWVMPVERVVGQILRAIRRRKAVAVVTRRWRLVAWILRRLPDRIYLNVR